MPNVLFAEGRIWAVSGGVGSVGGGEWYCVVLLCGVTVVSPLCHCVLWCVLWVLYCVMYYTVCCVVLYCA